ncbi:MAG: hypothetical protein M1831_001727 [Alyxoria varia]|nr:MAG: hypothetical protein M1831_001727 [Alyxoria varia]
MTSRLNGFDQPGSFNSGGSRTPRRLQKRTTADSQANNSRQPSAALEMSDTRASFIKPSRPVGPRVYQPPLGPRTPGNSSPSKRITSDTSPAINSRHGNQPLPDSTSEPFLGLSARRNTSNFSIGQDLVSRAIPQQPPSPTKANLEPQLQYPADNITEEVQLDEFPQPGGQNSGIDPFMIHPPRVQKNGQIMRHNSENRGPSVSPVKRNQAVRATQMSSGVGGNNPTSIPLTVRTRRQTQMPSAWTSNNNGVVPKQPRKSVGPGYTIPQAQDRSAFDPPSQNGMRNDPSMDGTPLPRKISNATARRISHAGGTTPVEWNNTNPNPSIERIPRPKRDNKTQSFQPSSRAVSGNRASSYMTVPSNVPNNPPPSEPVQIKQPTSRFNMTPNSFSAKRQSTAPNLVGGLGARTVSPTDARRSRRVSVVNHPPPMPERSPTPELSFGTQRAPTPPPNRRKSVTPSSSRATPEQNIRFSMGRPISSRSSYNSRPASGSSQRRPSLNGNPLPRASNQKSRNLHSSTGGEEPEFVPPVPAIPKAYESPSEVMDKPFFSDLSSSLGPTTTSTEPTKMTDDPPHFNTAGFNFWDQHKNRRLTLGVQPDSQKANANHSSGKYERLPPLNLQPLSTPTAAKIASFAQSSTDPTHESSTPPPYRASNKTPSTPMTASKANFSSIDAYRALALNPHTQQLRSSTSYGNTKFENPQHVESGGESPGVFDGQSPATPHLHSSPSSGSFNLTKTKDDSQQSTSQNPKDASRRRSRSIVRRPSTASKSLKDSASVHEKTQTDNENTAGSSIRRKLSLNWRRSSSKASHISQGGDDERGALLPHSDEMPPPKLPSAATTNNIIAKSPKVGNFSSSKNAASTDNLAKSSASAASKTGEHARNSKPGGLGINLPNDRHTPAARASSSIFSPVHKMLASRNSQSNLKHQRSQHLDKDDQAAEDEMKKLASKRRDFELAARELEDLHKRAMRKDPVEPDEATRLGNLNIFEKGEIIDFPHIYFTGTRHAKKHVGDLAAESTNFGFDDERGDYVVINGDHLMYRFEVIDTLGKGSFGQVVRCIDHKHGKLVAVKIIRNKKRFHQQALVEIDILKKLREWDPSNSHSMINFTQSFYFRGHLCISTELLGINLYEFIKAHDFVGFSLKLIRRFTKQMLASLSLLQDRNVIHCDLKPENILLAHPLHSEIKIIDFGSSCFDNEKVYTYIQSRFYRSPEVILGMSYGMPIDMWSLGCILAELYTGYPIFPGENEQEQLACIMEVFGPPEKHLIERSTRRKLFFDSLGKPRLTVSSKGKRRRPSSKTLSQALKCDDEAFLDFITRCLRWDPDRRMKPHEAIKHDFLTGNSKKSMRTRSQFLSNNGASSPAKRANTIQNPPASSKTRSAAPPDPPPATSYKNGVPAPAPSATSQLTGASRGPTSSSNTSPVKGSASGVTHSRRKSYMPEQVPSGPGLGTGTKKDALNNVPTGSALPRSVHAQRTASGKPDLASAAAIASLNGGGGGGGGNKGRSMSGV